MRFLYEVSSFLEIRLAIICFIALMEIEKMPIVQRVYMAYWYKTGCFFGKNNGLMILFASFFLPFFALSCSFRFLAICFKQFFGVIAEAGS